MPQCCSQATNNDYQQIIVNKNYFQHFALMYKSVEPPTFFVDSSKVILCEKILRKRQFKKIGSIYNFKKKSFKRKNLYPYIRLYTGFIDEEKRRVIQVCFLDYTVYKKIEAPFNTIACLPLYQFIDNEGKKIVYEFPSIFIYLDVKRVKTKFWEN